MADDERDRVNIQLQKSINTLKLKGDLKTISSIYNGVANDSVDCSGPLPGPPLNDIEPPLATVSPTSQHLGIIILLSLLTVASVIFGIKWYKSRKEVHVNDPSTSNKKGNCHHNLKNFFVPVTA